MRAGYARWVYSVVLYIAVPFVLLSLLWQSRKNSAYRKRWAERFGRAPTPKQTRPTLVHCASVGEFLAAKQFIAGLLEAGTPVWVTCTTPTGSELIREFLNGRGQHTYLPIDLPHALKRFLTRVQPQTVVLMETELWPNLVYYCQQRHIPVALINARMSERSLKGYLKVKALFQPSWQGLSLCGAQNDVQAERFLTLGVRKEALQVNGNLKFDVQIPAVVRRDVNIFKELLAGRQVLTAGSTHSGEESLILEAFSQLLQCKPNTLLILVPRHKERFDEVAKLVEQAGLTMVRRSSGRPITEATQVLLADSMGELMLWYGIASVAFVGGSLIARGGHNPLEPMAFGLPIISGRHVFNFEEVFQQLDQRQAVRWVSNVNNLHDTVLGLLGTLETAQRIGAQAQQLFARHRGATARTQAAVQQLLNERR